MSRAMEWDQQTKQNTHTKKRKAKNKKKKKEDKEERHTKGVEPGKPCAISPKTRKHKFH